MTTTCALDGDLVAELSLRVRAGLASVRQRITDAGGDPDATCVVAVTKGFGPEAVQAALQEGLADVGENYADELVAKAEVLAKVGEMRAVSLRWHFLGALQTNKIARLAPHVSMWQNLDSAEHAAAVAKRCPGADALVEVDITGVGGRVGCRPGDAAGIVEAARVAGLRVRGLMGVGPDPTDFGVGRTSAEAFAQLAQLASTIAFDGAPTLSMGMTADLEDAIRHGATMVRIGTALFGPRPRPPQRRTAPADSTSAAKAGAGEAAPSDVDSAGTAKNGTPTTLDDSSRGRS